MIRVARADMGGRVVWGLVDGETLAPLEGAYASTGALLQDGRDDIAAHGPQRPRVPLSEVTLLSPVTEDQQVLCQGANYREHMREAGLDPDAKAYNMFFRKASSCLCGARDAILRPHHVGLLDYEIELGMVLGRDIVEPERFDGEELPDAVAAVVIHNDVSARDVQIPQMQFYKGKSYRTFGPTGPWLTLVDDALRTRWRELRLELTVNGEVRQSEVASEMVFEPAESLTEWSALQTLRAGDLVATGTPSGVAMRLPAPWLVRLFQMIPERRRWPLFIGRQARSGRYLRDGDVVGCRIASDDGAFDLGTLENPVAAAPS
ncbi:MAG: fumarylacetoacetate hydrolase family protein [Myxococcota bacterium]